MNKIFIYLIIFALLLTFSNCFGQFAKPDTIKQNPKSYWGTFGFGASTIDYAFTAALNAELSGNYVVSASAQAEFNRFEINILGPASGDFTYVYNYDLLFGKIFKQRISFFTISAGLGVINYTSYTDSVYVISQGSGLFNSTYGAVTINQRNRYALNIPILLQGYLVIAKPVAIGFSGYVNLNRVHTTAGITLNIALGRMTTRKGKTLSDYPHPHPLPPLTPPWHP